MVEALCGICGEQLLETVEEYSTPAREALTPLATTPDEGQQMSWEEANTEWLTVEAGTEY